MRIRTVVVVGTLFVAVAITTGAVLIRDNGRSTRVATGSGSTTTCSVASSTTATSTPSSSTSIASTTSTMPPQTSTTIPALGPLRVGSKGRGVLALEERLGELGYWIGVPDDRYDATTAHAVVAFQKLNGLDRDGIAGNDVAARLAVAPRPKPRSDRGHVIEIDLTHQVLLVADAATTTATLDVSTGRVAGTTPVGHFKVTREVDGYDRGPLGVLYRPKYFFKGVSVHGYPSVPPYPASHGCVRTTNAAMDWLWASGTMPVGTSVWVYR